MRATAHRVSKTRPKLSTQLVIPCWKMERTLVLLMITSAHWTCRQKADQGELEHQCDLDDSEEVGAVAGELQDAPLRVGPLLAPAVLHHHVLLLPTVSDCIMQFPRQPCGGFDLSEISTYSFSHHP